MSNLHRVCSTLELQEKKALGAKVDGLDVALFAVNGAIVATQGKCPHANGPLCKGTIAGMTLSCPWHGWSYDLTTGTCEEDPAIQLRFFDVRVEGGEVFVVT